MASKKKKAAKAGAGALSTGMAVKDNPYVQRLVEDDELRENLRTAFESAKKAYGRMANGKGPAKAIMDDKKTQKDLKETANSLREAADSLRGAKKKRKRRPGRVLLVVVVGAGLALALSESTRKKVLDGLFGAEEEFEYTSSTTPASSGSNSTGEPVGSTSSSSSGSDDG
ncbi:MAG: hypothetical protein H0V29_04100 [Thermoleophilaceae bacterium]|nr:hypothetical protein [Thermoleophilaceae bacterium]